MEYLDIPQEILLSHMTPTGQKKDHRNDLYLQERRGESCESTSPVNYKECASRPYLSFRNLYRHQWACGASCILYTTGRHGILIKF